MARRALRFYHSQSLVVGQSQVLVLIESSETQEETTYFAKLDLMMIGELV